MPDGDIEGDAVEVRDDNEVGLDAGDLLSAGDDEAAIVAVHRTDGDGDAVSYAESVGHIDIDGDNDGFEGIAVPENPIDGVQITDDERVGDDTGVSDVDVVLDGCADGVAGIEGIMINLKSAIGPAPKYRSSVLEEPIGTLPKRATTAYEASFNVGFVLVFGCVAMISLSSKVVALFLGQKTISTEGEVD